MASDWINATITIWEQILPAERIERYESALEQLFEETRRGELVGAGTQLGEDGTVAAIEIQVNLEASDDMLHDVANALGRRGVPQHSRLCVHRDDGDDELEFGVAEGIEIRLPTMPAERAFDALLDRLVNALGGDADYRGAHVIRDRELALLFYGVDAEDLWRQIEPEVTSDALCRGAKVVIRCGHPDGKPRHFAVPA